VLSFSALTRHPHPPLLSHRWDAPTSSYLPTSLGKATLASGMAPEEALQIKADLSRAREAFVMSTDLHLTFLVTPPSASAEMDQVSACVCVCVCAHARACVFIATVAGNPG
jgi:hypothetical protein